jgi:DNA repair exonuclease SbcCD ATPase subunit
MKKIIFEELKIKNFLSIGEAPVVLNFNKGLNIITGINKDLDDRQNGTGKSTILDAFYFSIFGETTRELKKEFIVNNVTNSTSEVSLTFSINSKKYKIVRTIKPSKCFLYEDDVDISRDSMANTTQTILNVLSISPQIFTNCLGLSINATVPFMAQKKADKRNFIESIFNLDIFSKMNLFLKEDYSILKKDIENVSVKHSELLNSINVIKNQIESVKKERLSRKIKIEESIKNFESRIKKLNEEIKTYDIKNNSELELKIKKLENKINDSEKIIKSKLEIFYSIKKDRELLKEKLEHIGTDEDECPVCLKNITSDDSEHIEKRKKEIQVKIDKSLKNSEEIDKESELENKQKELYKKAINVLKENIIKNNLAIQSKKNKEEQISFIRDQYNKDLKSLEDLNNETLEANNSTKELDDKLKKYAQELKDKKNNLKILEDIKFILSEEGVKAYIVKKILTLFNRKITYYLEKLNSKITIMFDQYFEESIKNERGKETMYFNYSGAEKKAIDLAIMFAFIDMLKLQNNVYYNVQFYDELLDTSLDASGVENVIKLLNEFVEKNSYGIYVISHRKECSKFAKGEVIYLEKNNGITERIDYVNA